MDTRENIYSEVLAYIENADDMQLNAIMDAVEHRYRTAYPEWEVIYVAVHREKDQRKRDIDSIIDLLYRT